MIWYSTFILLSFILALTLIQPGALAETVSRAKVIHKTPATTKVTTKSESTYKTKVTTKPQSGSVPAPRKITKAAIQINTLAPGIKRTFPGVGPIQKVEIVRRSSPSSFHRATIVEREKRPVRVRKFIMDDDSVPLDDTKSRKPRKRVGRFSTDPMMHDPR